MTLSSSAVTATWVTVVAQPEAVLAAQGNRSEKPKEAAASGQ